MANSLTTQKCYSLAYALGRAPDSLTGPEAHTPAIMQVLQVRGVISCKVGLDKTLLLGTGADLVYTELSVGQVNVIVSILPRNLPSK